MELAFSEIVFFGTVFEPCQLEFEGSVLVMKIDELEASVVRGFFAEWLKIKSGFVESDAFFQIQYVEIKMSEFKHDISLLI